jgi:myo-inositol-1-phosphate synthase
MEGTTFGNVPISCELKMEVWDSPNSAGVVIDAVRCARLALDRGIGGALVGPSSYLMKSPPVQFSDSEACERMEAFIQRDVGPVRPKTPGHEPPNHAPCIPPADVCTKGPTTDRLAS